jgi:hypothetical protein
MWCAAQLLGEPPVAAGMTRSLGWMAALAATVTVGLPAAAQGAATPDQRCRPDTGERVVAHSRHVVVLGRPDRAGSPADVKPVKRAWQRLVGCRRDTGKRRELVTASDVPQAGPVIFTHVAVGGWWVAWVGDGAVSVADVRRDEPQSAVVRAYVLNDLEDSVDFATVDSLQSNDGGAFAWRARRPLADTIETWGFAAGPRLVVTGRAIGRLHLARRAVGWTAGGVRRTQALSTPDACNPAPGLGGGPGIDRTLDGFCDRATGRSWPVARTIVQTSYAGPYVLASSSVVAGPSFRIDVRDGSTIDLPLWWTTLAPNGAVARVSACGVQVLDGAGMHQFPLALRIPPYELAAIGATIAWRASEDNVASYETQPGPISPEAVAQAAQCHDPRFPSLPPAAPVPAA